MYIEQVVSQVTMFAPLVPFRMGWRRVFIVLATRINLNTVEHACTTAKLTAAGSFYVMRMVLIIQILFRSLPSVHFHHSCALIFIFYFFILGPHVKCFYNENGSLRNVDWMKLFLEIYMYTRTYYYSNTRRAYIHRANKSRRKKYPNEFENGRVINATR